MENHGESWIFLLPVVFSKLIVDNDGFSGEGCDDSANRYLRLSDGGFQVDTKKEDIPLFPCYAQFRHNLKAKVLLAAAVVQLKTTQTTNSGTVTAMMEE